jgi:hypothetical protein
LIQFRARQRIGRQHCKNDFLVPEYFRSPIDIIDPWLIDLVKIRQVQDSAFSTARSTKARNSYISSELNPWPITAAP